MSKIVQIINAATGDYTYSRPPIIGLGEDDKIYKWDYTYGDRFLQVDKPRPGLVENEGLIHQSKEV